MPPNPSWLSVPDAREKILAGVSPIADTTTVAVENALMRVIGENVVAPFNVPGPDNSAMDGFACRIADVGGDNDAVLRVVGDSFAGHPYHGAFAAGECVKIMTGARLPAAADVVVPQEETSRPDSAAAAKSVVVRANPARRKGLHLRRAGEDLR